MTVDLDHRIVDVLADAAESTATRDDALAEILRRADRVRPGPSGRQLMMGAAVAGVVAAGAAGIVLWAPGSSDPPARGSATDMSVPAVATTLPVSGRVDDPLFYDDATLLSILYVNFDVGAAADMSRMVDSGDPSSTSMTECMRDHGFQEVAPPLNASITTDPRYTMEPAEFAATYGFGVAAERLGLLPLEGHNDVDDYRATLSPSELVAYDDASNDCLTQAVDDGEVEITPQSWVAAHDYAAAEFQPIVDGDDRVVAALATWQRCMAAAGFDYNDPAAIGTTFYTQSQSVAPGGGEVAEGSPERDQIEQLMAEEIAVATANATCVEPYTAMLREVVLDHFGEYKSIFEAALASNVPSDGVG